MTVFKSNQSVMTSYRNIHEIILNTFLENYHSIIFHSKGGQAIRTKEKYECLEGLNFPYQSNLEITTLNLNQFFVGILKKRPKNMLSLIDT